MTWIGQRTPRVVAVLVALGAAVTAIVTSFAGAAALPATGNGIAPAEQAGSTVFANCSSATGQAHIFGFKVTKGSVATYNGVHNQSSSGVEATHVPNNPLAVTVSSASVASGIASFSWSANLPVDFVYVKSGTGATVYDYSSYGWGGHPAKGPFGDSGLVSSSDSISHILFCTIKKLRVEKSATGTFTRTHTWQIAKQVKTSGGFGSSARLVVQTGSSGTATWQVVATKTGSTDSSPSVNGQIATLNASPSSASVTLAESLAGVTFSAGCPGFTLAVGEARTCDYGASLQAALPGTNSVTATATNLAWMAPTSASAAYSFTVPSNEINDTVRWTDTASTAKTGITATDAHEYATQPACSGGDFDYVNTVTLYGEENQQLGTSSATLTVDCQPAPSPSPPAASPPPTSLTSPPPAPVLTPPTPKKTTPKGKPKLPPTPKSTSTRKSAPKPKPTPSPKRKPGPLTPPSSRAVPVAAPPPVTCVKIGLSTKWVPMGERVAVTLQVTSAGKPISGISVRFRGPGISKVAESGKKGRVSTTLAAPNPGIVNVTVVGRPGCVAKRIGIVGPFEPPVTGFRTK